MRDLDRQRFNFGVLRVWDYEIEGRRPEWERRTEDWRGDVGRWENRAPDKDRSVE